MMNDDGKIKIWLDKDVEGAVGWRLTSDDISYQVKKVIKERDEENDASEQSTNRTYHSNLEHALETYARERIRMGKSTDLDELYERFEDVKEHIKDIKERLCDVRGGL